MIPQFGYLAPFFFPFSVLVWLMNKRNTSYTGRMSISLTEVDLAILSTILVWIVAELLHTILGQRETQLRLVANMVYIWVAYYTLMSFGCEPTWRSTVLRGFVIICLVWSIFAFLSILYTAEYRQLINPDINLSNLRNDNGLALVMSFSLAIALLERPFLFRPLIVLCFIFPFTLLYSITVSARGGIILIVLTVFFHIVQLITERNRLFLLLYFSFAVVAVSYFHLPMMEAIENIMIVFGPVPHAYDFTAHSLPGDVASVYSRFSTISLNMEFLSVNPILGIGVKGVEELKIIDTGLHSALLYPFFAYGIFGTVPYILLLFYIVYEGVRLGGMISFYYVLCLGWILMVSADFVYWCGLGLYAILGYQYHGDSGVKRINKLLI